MKYLIIKDGLKGGQFETAVLFSPVIKHSEIAKGFVGLEVVSAGFVEIDVNGSAHVGTEGSVSLGIETRGERDARIIRRDLRWPNG